MLQLPVICTSLYVPFVNKDLLSDRLGIVKRRQNTPSVGIDDIMQSHRREEKQPIAVSDISIYLFDRYQKQIQITTE